MATLDTVMPGASGWLSLPYATAAALVLEALLVAAFIIGLSDTKKISPPKRQLVMLTFPAMPETPAPKVRVKPASRPLLPTPIHPTVHRPTPQAHQVETPDIAPEPLAMAPAMPDTVPAPPQITPEKTSPPSADPSIRARFEDQVRAAVQSAMRYPYAAKLAHIAGRAKVSFKYVDGRVSGVRVITSSGYDVLDSAARQAVSAAAYPPPPKNLAGTSIPFEVWVRFYLSGPASD